jgi:hypothetical protein
MEKNNVFISVDVMEHNGDYLQDLKTYINLIADRLNIRFDGFATDEKAYKPIKGNYLESILTAFKKEEFVKLSIEVEGDYFALLLDKNIHHTSNHALTLNSGKQEFDILSFFKEIIHHLNLIHTASVHDASHIGKLFREIYKPFHRKQPEIDLCWLNYFGKSALEALDANILLQLPYATKIELIKEGVFIQIGDTAEDATTPAVEERLFKSMEWIYQMLESKKTS